MCPLSGRAAPRPVPLMLLESARHPSKAGISEKIPAPLKKTVPVAISPSCTFTSISPRDAQEYLCLVGPHVWASNSQPITDPPGAYAHTVPHPLGLSPPWVSLHHGIALANTLCPCVPPLTPHRNNLWQPHAWTVGQLRLLPTPGPLTPVRDPPFPQIHYGCLVSPRPFS